MKVQNLIAISTDLFTLVPVKQWFGKIEAGGVENFHLAKQGEGSLPLQDHFVKTVHYSDCQQLIIWLPEPGDSYGELYLRDGDTGKLVTQWPVASKLSGSIQLIWDTLDIAPGKYRIEIDRKGQVVHCFQFIKYKEGEEPPPPPAPNFEADPDAPPIVYRDGFGNLIENEDLALRERVIQETLDKFTRRLQYRDMGRGGTVIYLEGNTRIEFYYELGGGDCVAYIDIPSPDKWEQATQTPLSRREDIILFTAERARADQASSCSIRITDTSISFHKK